MGIRVDKKALTKQLELENAKLKRMFADMAIQNEALKDVIEKKL